MPKAKNQERLKNSPQVISKFIIKMHSSHLFQIDETFPVNIPCKQKQFLIPEPVRVRQLISISI